MPAFSLSIETCMKTMPDERDADERRSSARPRTRRSRQPRVARRALRARRDGAARAAARDAGGGASRGGARGMPARRRRRAARARRRGARGRARAGGAWRRSRAARVARACGGRGGAASCGGAASSSFRAARRRADFARGLAAISPGVGATARRVSSSASGSRPQTQTGRSGGQMQPRARSARKRFTRRSSSEWNEIPAKRPFGRRMSQASGQRARRAGRAHR